ncbi:MULTISPECIES: ABC transporter ATP-binding protein [Clostridium]|jgi:ABC-2 type transport system ATP-binding protein|uniref:ABC transporter ATP-binding protein n=1 Tax=Clostridium TaxID=1485 RepID=UPI0018AAFF5A|nr:MULTISPECIES: ABC transporter ATP-binding protein [Clostridium]MBS5305076.1 ABC transporter ATP-binding protein [Clostridium sp.]MDB1932351.1 ABC transporter ATP-binding protein [Clostridium tertium]MDB1936503.1 ABC transporter ATP-binding protein [Clostridium tertium]MDB1942918.1 ABC transporter ATP-binding protein [Clostridium tertium]MDB1950019.1 ABC transporter ATP-binding protein [Clostridium tertium]
METNQILEIIDLKKSFGEKQVLKGINLKINKGSIIGYIGPNGAGKSTTVKIIMGLVTGYTGEIRIFGEDISKDDGSYRKKIGYVPEVPEIYDSLTGKEYLTFIAQLYDIDYDKADNKARKLMDILGIADVYEKRISSYSKGMKQKLILISSLIHDPEILFLDEPLSGLDANSVMIIKEILSYLAKEGKTIFYSSHIMEVVEKISDRIILINNGEIVADGNFEELKSNYKESSLESIFNEVTGFHQYKELAENFISVVKEV